MTIRRDSENILKFNLTSEETHAVYFICLFYFIFKIVLEKVETLTIICLRKAEL
jgi:hypothetical protein